MGWSDVSFSFSGTGQISAPNFRNNYQNQPPSELSRPPHPHFPIEPQSLVLITTQFNLKTSSGEIIWRRRRTTKFSSDRRNWGSDIINNQHNHYVYRRTKIKLPGREAYVFYWGEMKWLLNYVHSFGCFWLNSNETSHRIKSLRGGSTVIYRRILSRGGSILRLGWGHL